MSEPTYPVYNPAPCPCIAIIPAQGLGPEMIIGPFDYTSQMSNLADVKILAATIVLAEGGPFFGLKPDSSLIYEQFGVDQAINPQQGVPEVILPTTRGDNRRAWYLQPGSWAGGSVCAPLIALMYAQGVGKPGKWIWGGWHFQYSWQAT